jgi:multidrug resistance efflux pump
MVAVLVLAAAVVGLVLTDPFTGGGARTGIDNGTATSLATVLRRSLTSQTQVDGTLEYADSATVVVPAGTAPSAVRQAQQSVASAESALRTAKAALASDERLLARARAKLAADRSKRRDDCRGDGAATASSGSDSSAASSPCSLAAQAVASDEDAVTSAAQKVATDKGSVVSATETLSAARQSLDVAGSSALLYETGATYTKLPSAGDVTRRGESLYAIGGQPVLLLYGDVTAWRAFRPGMSDGPDVAALNANLRALGYGALTGRSFTAATVSAIRALQSARGLASTGELPLGSVVFAEGPVRVTSVTPSLGQAVQAGEVLSVTSTSRQVTIALNADQQSDVKVGDPVTITLPSNRTVHGRVSFVGTVASVPSGDNADQNSTPTIEVDVTPSDPTATGTLDHAPVQVSITTASANNVLVVPVGALLALAGGGYAVEVADAAGGRRLVPVELGLFDDAEGLVEVGGAGLQAGQRVVVPGS